ncbi:hypothetical protein A9Q81_01820 [Gammaproteobacteria bacterium 42_54_T18]|nr:hypothetical protein A9Q81_01820 [Gammaproteobacteria bacterium 42_54_T18]
MHFTNLTFKTALCFLLLVSLAGCIHPHHGRRAVTVHKAAPLGQVWVAGHWAVRKRNRVWVAGHWR